MTTAATIIIAEIPIVTTAAFAVIAWMVQRLIHRVDAQAEELRVLTTDQADSEAQLGQLSMRVTTLEKSGAHHDRRLMSLGESMAVLAAFVESHERWHERHDDTHTTGH